MKLDLKQTLKELYKTSHKEVVFIKVPPQKIIGVKGKGDPNTSIEFKNAIEALYPIAYTLKFTYKKEGKDFAVMPLEGLWWANDMKEFLFCNKNNWFWKIFIVLPDFVTEKNFNTAVNQVKEKKNPVSLSKIKFETLNEGNAAQILHIGKYADEGPTIQKLHNAIQEKGNTFDGLKQKHHEIYLSDMRKKDPANLKTIIRQPII